MSDAVRNAISDESTGCEAPSLMTHLTPTMGKPMSGPFLTASLKPFSQAGMNSRGIEPPMMSSTNSKPVGCSAGNGSM